MPANIDLLRICRTSKHTRIPQDQLDESNETTLALVSFWLGRYHEALTLSSQNAPQLCSHIDGWIDALDRKASFVPEPAACHSGASHDQQGRIWQLDGAYTVHDGAQIGFRAWLSYEAPPEQTPWLIHFHGTAERAIDYTEYDPDHHLPASLQVLGNSPEVKGAQQYLKLWAEMGNDFAKLPASVLFVDFRGFGWSSGPPRFSTLFSDAEALVQELPQIALDCELPWPYPGPMILVGKSAGSLTAVHLAALFSHCDLFDGLVLDAPVGCLWPQSRVFRNDAEGLDEFRAAFRAAGGVPLQLTTIPDHIQGTRFDCACCGQEGGEPIREQLEFTLDLVDKIAFYDGPLLVLHAPGDEVCPWPGGADLVEAAAAPESLKRLVRVDGAGHQTFVARDVFWPAVGSFLTELVARKQSKLYSTVLTDQSCLLHGMEDASADLEWEVVD